MLIILTTHPIQYQVPLWQRLAADGRIDFQVWYMSDHALRPSFDREFGQTFAWDLDLTAGYSHRFIDAPRHDITSFLGARLIDFDRDLRAAGATALLVNGWQTAAYWDAIWAAYRIGVPVWLRAESNDLRRTPLWKRGIKRVILRRLFDRVSKFLTIGTANRRLYRSYGIDNHRLHSTPYAVDNARFGEQARHLAPCRNVIREAWGIDRNAFCVLFAGKLINKKRPHDLIDAVGALESRTDGSIGSTTLHLLFAGDGALRDELKRRCTVRFDRGKLITPARDETGPNASFAGFLNQPDIAQAYVAADCLVLPSDSRETWGLVVNEAMASGTPCIVSDACGCAEDLVAPLDEALVFRQGDSGDLARAIAQAAARPLPRARIVEHVAQWSLGRSVDTIVALSEGRPWPNEPDRRRVGCTRLLLG